MRRDIVIPDLAKRLDYREDGKLVWRDGPKAGKVAGGGRHPKGYFSVNGVRAHRIIFYKHHGYLPEQVDHINGNNGDNRIENLRPATNAQNQMNKPGYNPKSGYKNVYWHESSKRWRVIVKKNGKQHGGGRYRDVEEANEAAKALRKKLHGDYCWD